MAIVRIQKDTAPAPVTTAATGYYIKEATKPPGNKLEKGSDDADISFHGNIIVKGRWDAPIMVVVDVPSKQSFDLGVPLPPSYYRLFAQFAAKNGFHHQDFVFVTPSAPFPERCDMASAQSAHLKAYREEFANVSSQFTGQAVITFGANAAQQVMNRAVKITRIRGVVSHTPTFWQPLVAMMSPGQVLKQPHHALGYRADFEMVRQLRDADYDATALKFDVGQDYKWVNAFDFKRIAFEYINNRPDPTAPLPVSMDTETTGGKWTQGAKPIMAQVSFEMGQGLGLPLDVHMCARVLAGDAIEYAEGEDFMFTQVVVKDRKRWESALLRARGLVATNKRVFKEFMEEEWVPLVLTGQNFKYDIHVCRNMDIHINTSSWEHDTMQLAFVMDENIQSKDLASITKIWIPPLAGYSDAFENKVDYSRMDKVRHDVMLDYGCADTDTCFRLTRRLVPDAMQDERHYRNYELVQMPALRMFVDVEARGFKIDTEKLKEFADFLTIKEEALYEELLSAVPGSIKLKWFDPKKPRDGLSLTRPDFVIDHLFLHEDGLKLEPKVFTPAHTEENPCPSLSTKTHLPYFEEEMWVAQFMEWQKMQKLLTTYVGLESSPKHDGNPTGLWQYITKEGYIHPSYWVHRTVTGRTASSDPNGQNIPKRGELATEFRKNIVPREGYSFLELDLSQAELRIAAWMAKETNMLRLYRDGQDIHAATAAAIIGITLERFKAGLKDESLLIECANSWKGSGAFLQHQSPGERKKIKVNAYLKHARQQAKAVNFGFLYGMGAKKFMAYAKTSYQVDVTLEEAYKMRETFFKLYPKLVKWHEDQREFVNHYGFVRSLTGALRHLPDIYSVDEGIRSSTERQAINSPVQRFGSDLALMGAIRLHRDLKIRGGDDCYIVAFIHDAIIIEVKKGLEHEFASYGKWYIESVPLKKWFNIVAPLPIIADVACCYDNLGVADEKSFKDTIAKCPAWFTSD